MSKGKFELYQDKRGEYRFRLKASNGENIGKSEGYKAKQSANNGIESVRKNSSDEENYVIWQSEKNEEWYFNLKSGNNQVILAGSEGYSSKQGAKNGTKSVGKNAPDAELDDQT